MLILTATLVTSTIAESSNSRRLASASKFIHLRTKVLMTVLCPVAIHKRPCNLLLLSKKKKCFLAFKKVKHFKSSLGFSAWKTYFLLNRYIALSAQMASKQKKNWASRQQKKHLILDYHWFGARVVSLSIQKVNKSFS